MDKEKLKNEVDRIIKFGCDPEIAHSKEDRLHFEIINEFCPDWVKEEIDRLRDADFPRWYA